MTDNTNLMYTESSDDEEFVGTYGMQWIDFMERNHPRLVAKMQKKGNFFAVVRSVDDAAWDYRELLDNQYAQMYPRPTGFEETVSWEYTRAFYTDSEVMRDRVLIAITEP